MSFRTSRVGSGGSLATLSDVTITGPTDGQVLTYDSGTGRWVNDNPAGTGDVVGPGSATDNAIVRFNGATGTSIQNSGVIISDTDDIATPGMFGAGPNQQSGTVSGGMRFVDLAWTVTDFTPVNSWRTLTNRLIVDPDADYTSDSATANFSQVMLQTGNVNDFGTLTATTSLAQHFGTGTVTSQQGHVVTSTLNGGGSITTNIVLGISGVTQPAATGTIGTNQVLVIQSGPTGVASTVTLNESIHIRTPRPEGTTTKNRAIFIETQVGPGTSHVLYSEGGQSWHQGFFGIGDGLQTPSLQLEVLNDIQITSTSTTGSYLHLVNTNTGGYDWRIRSNGSADVGGAGVFCIHSFSDGTVPMVILPVTNNIGFGTTSPAELVHVNGNTRVDGRLLTSQAANTIAAANDLTLDADGNVFVITGNTQINAIATAGWRNGSIVVLRFTGTPTIKNQTAGGAGFASLKLDGSTDLTAAADTVLGIYLDGTDWQQLFVKAA